MKAGFASGFRKCRTCLATDQDIQTKFDDEEFIHRSPEHHAEICKLLSIKSLHCHFSKIYGLNRDCLFNKLTHYHIVGGLPPDVMHDLLEGVVPLIICKVISKALENGKKRNFNLESLNHCIRNFSYSQSEARDKPSVISDTHLKNGSLRQSSSQIWLLMTYLPIILLNEVPEIERTTTWQSFKDYQGYAKLSLVITLRISIYFVYEL